MSISPEAFRFLRHFTDPWLWVVEIVARVCQIEVFIARKERKITISTASIYAQMCWGKLPPSESFDSLTELQKIDSKVSGNREQWKCAQFSTIIFRVFPMKSWIWRSAFGDSLMKSLNIIDIFAFKSVATKEHSPIIFAGVNYHLFQGGWCFFSSLWHECEWQ